MRVRARASWLAVLLAVAWFHPAPLPAQDMQEALREAERVLGRPVTAQEALRLLQQSGLTADQIRDRLEQRGYPRNAADAYLSVLEGRSEAAPEGAAAIPLLEVLTGATFVPEGVGAAPPDSLLLQALGLQGLVPGIDTLALAKEEEEGPPIFGREIFRRATTQFQPLLTGPAPADYRVGPGDELIVVLTGDVELAYRLPILREGWIVIPDVGRVTVAGSTLAELRERLTRRLSEVYSGLTGDEKATTFLDLSLGTLRTNLIYVIGEVERPGAYELPGFGSVFAALYQAGGPTRTGSFRRIYLNRGGRIRASVDLYDYLLEGRAAPTPRLEQGDVIFVPVARRRVEIDGAVVRPGIYELAEGDDLHDVIEFAGGLAPNAAAARVQIERTLPPEQQEEGLNRILLDVPITGAAADREIPLVDGDRISVFAVLEELRNAVRVTGGVWRPGSYGVQEDTRLWDVIQSAGGLLPDAYEGRAQIQRLQDDYTRRMIQVSLARDARGNPIENPSLEPLDQIYVFARRDLREERVVSIGGWVREPGVYPYVDGMTVRDLVLRAGGLRTGAYLGAVDVARIAIEQQRGDTITRTFTVALDSTLVFDVSRRPLEGARPANGTAGRDAEFELQNLDAVYVRKAPGFEPQRRVVVTGEVMFPGPYSLTTRTERLTDLIERAGGLTPQAYAEGLQLWRAEPEAAVDTLTAIQLTGQAFGDTTLAGFQPEAAGAAEGDTLAAAPLPRQGVSEAVARTATGAGKEEPEEITRTRVGVRYVEALKDPASAQNLLVEPNDSIYVPSFIPTVDVRGAVQAPTKVVYRKGAGVDYYIRRAGGYLRNADKGRARVQLANGEVLTRGPKFLFFGGGIPDPDPGSVITVPAKPPKEPGGATFAQLAAVFTGILTATATIVIAAKR